MRKYEFYVGMILMMFVAVCGYGQSGRDSVLWRIERFLEQLQEDENDAAVDSEEMQASRTMAYEHFERLLERPLAINRASRRELEQLFILSDFQINSLITYREEHGAVLSAAELSLLNGFNEQIAGVLKWFIVFDNDSGELKSNGNFFRDCRSDLLLKLGGALEQDKQGWRFPNEVWPRSKDGHILLSGRELSVSPAYTYLRYGCNYLNKVQMGFTIENDAGEKLLGSWQVPLSDFFSFHVAFNQIRIGKMKADVILGDFSARFGQGLTLWKSFSLNSVASPSGLSKRGATVSAYTSADETNFLRGVAIFAAREFTASAWSGLRAVELTGVFSYNGVDANVKDGAYTSVIKGGLHRPGDGAKSRKTMYETLVGLNSVFIFSKWKLGVSWATYGYDKRNGRKVAEYNKHQIYNGMWGDVSADFYGVVGRVRFFGELAVDYGFNPAGLLGGVFQAGEVELGVLARGYAKGYISPHAGAYTTASGCFNQIGVTVNANWSRWKTFVFSGNFDFAHYPGARYGVLPGSSILKGSVKGEYKRTRWDGYLRIAGSFATDKDYRKLGVKLSGGYALFENLRLGIKGEWVLVRGNFFGSVCGTEFVYTVKNERFRVRAGAAYFYAPQWDVRLYWHEAGLPNSYSSVLLYGEGIRGYVTSKVRLFRFCDLYGKVEMSGHKKGGGESELPAPRFKIQLGMKMAF